jgi:hypothetical protein
MAAERSAAIFLSNRNAGAPMALPARVLPEQASPGARLNGSASPSGDGLLPYGKPDGGGHRRQKPE